MSKNSVVTDVYTRVIKDVIEASREDFEAGGVDLSALELLRQGWQKRLSAEKIAAFPWDPKPENVQSKQEAQLVPDRKVVPTTLPSNGRVNTPPSLNSTPGPQIKQETQYATQPPLQANYGAQGHPQQSNAQARAAGFLQERFGDQANRQIAELQTQSRIPSTGQPSRVPQQPQIKQEFKQEDPYQQGWPQASQVDGAADDWQDEFARRKTLVSQHREASDKLIRDHVTASQQAMEGGGLLMPLEAHMSSKPAPPATSSVARAQGDATGDDDDEDAINSDLDDPDELDENEGDDANVSNVMLCTYDKVQRVKNKWKCTLKDGVLKVNGEEYVFHKGQGEFEW